MVAFLSTENIQLSVVSSGMGLFLVGVKSIENYYKGLQNSFLTKLLRSIKADSKFIGDKFILVILNLLKIK